MRTIARFTVALTAVMSIVTLGIPEASHALSCIQETPQEKYERAAFVVTVRTTSVTRTSGSSFGASSNFEVTAEVLDIYKGIISGDSITFIDNVWTGGPEGQSRFTVGQEYLVHIGSDRNVGMCDYPTRIENISAETRSFLDSLSGQEHDCSPYICRDGTTYDKCGPDGSPINYFAPPCTGNGGVVGESDGMSPFTDVSSDDPYYEPVAWAKAEGVVEGYADGTFRPLNTLNRAEFVKILMESIGAGGPGLCRMATFADASLSEWYGQYVHAARCMGVVKGYPDGTFRPARDINFAEAAKIIAETSSDQEFTASDPWYETYVDFLWQHDAVPSTIETMDQLITRAEMVEIMWRLELSMQVDAEGGLTEDYVKQTYGQECEIVNSCNGMTYVDCMSAADGPAYYIENDSRAVVARCGGFCMMGGCTDCPPDSWTCDR